MEALQATDRPGGQGDQLVRGDPVTVAILQAWDAVDGRPRLSDLEALCEWVGMADLELMWRGLTTVRAYAQRKSQQADRAN